MILQLKYVWEEIKRKHVVGAVSEVFEVRNQKTPDFFLNQFYGCYIVDIFDIIPVFPGYQVFLGIVKILLFYPVIVLV